eukprot:6954342-Ditylum_brightwellii.AAC.1
MDKKIEHGQIAIGYFDQYGFTWDIMQNHLLQVLTLPTMEPPIEANGPTNNYHVHDTKIQ